MPAVPTQRKPLADELGAMAFLQASPLCKGLSDEHWSELVTAGTLDSYATAAVVLREGTQADVLYVVFEGTATLHKQHKGAPVEVAQLERGQIFGELAVLTQTAQPCSVTAHSDLQVIALKGAVVRQLAETEPKLGRKLAALMAGREKEVEKRLL